MKTFYQKNIEDSRRNFDIVYESALQSCKSRVPVPYVEDKSYLVCYQDGEFLGFARTSQAAQEVARQYILNFGETHVNRVDVTGLRGAHMYYVIYLYPDSHWSKKYLANQEYLTPFDSHTYFSANQFYEIEYLETFRRMRSDAAQDAMMIRYKKRSEENNEFLIKIFVGLVLLIWIFSSFSCSG